MFINNIINLYSTNKLQLKQLNLKFIQQTTIFWQNIKKSINNRLYKIS